MQAPHTRRLMTVLLLALLGLAACAQPGAAPQSPLPPAETPIPTQETAAPATGTIGTIEGTVTYAAANAPPAGAVVEVYLVDNDFGTFGTTTLTISGEPPPLPFTIDYDLDEVDPNGGYALIASVRVDGQVTGMSQAPVMVITLGFPTQGVTLTLSPNAVE